MAVPEEISRRARWAQVALAGTAVAVGLLGVLRAGDVGFSVNRSVPLIDSRWVDGPLLTLNRTGALVIAALGAVSLAGALMRRGRLLVWAAAGGFAIVALQVLAQYGRSANVLGANGSNLSFALVEGVGLLALSFLTRPMTPPQG